MWQVLLSNIPAQIRIVHSYVHGLFDCSCPIVALPAYDHEIFHRCCMASVVLVLKYWWWCFQMFFIPFSKPSRWFPYELIFTVNPVIPEPVNQITLLFFVMLPLSFDDTSRFFRVVPPLKCTCIPHLWQMFLKLSLMPWVYRTTIWYFSWWIMDYASSWMYYLVGVVFGGFYLWPNWDTCFAWGLLLDVVVHWVTILV